MPPPPSKGFLGVSSPLRLGLSNRYKISLSTRSAPKVGWIECVEEPIGTRKLHLEISQRQDEGNAGKRLGVHAHQRE